MGAEEGGISTENRIGLLLDTTYIYFRYAV